MTLRKRTAGKPGAVMRKVRKPLAPPTRVEETTTKYRRARERERLRREQAGEGNPQGAAGNNSPSKSS